MKTVAASADIVKHLPKDFIHLSRSLSSLRFFPRSINMLKNLCTGVMTGLLFLLTASLHGTEAIANIPDQDRECLNQFFQYLLYKSPMGYTLFGDKPISQADYLDPKDCIGIDLRQSFLIEKGWETWVSYQALFPSEKFVLKKEKRVSNTNTIIMINKTQVLVEISRNLDLFQKKFGQEILPEEILRQICETNEPLFDYLGDQALIGILLGFGRTNAVLFSRENEIEDYLQTRLTPPFSCLDEVNQLSFKSQEYLHMGLKSQTSKNRSLASSFPQCAEEFNSIISKRAFFELPGDDRFLTRMGSPRFIDYGESSELVNSYAKTRRTLRKAYQKGSLLQVTLNQWTNPQFPGEKR